MSSVGAHNRHYVLRWFVRLSVRPLTPICRFFLSMKLARNIHHVTGNCCKGFQSQRTFKGQGCSEVKYTSMPSTDGCPSVRIRSLSSPIITIMRMNTLIALIVVWVAGKTM